MTEKEKICRDIIANENLNQFQLDMLYKICDSPLTAEECMRNWQIDPFSYIAENWSASDAVNFYRRHRGDMETIYTREYGMTPEENRDDDLGACRMAIEITRWKFQKLFEEYKSKEAENDKERV